MSAVDPYTQQEQADFDLWSVPSIQYLYPMYLLLA